MDGQFLAIAIVGTAVVAARVGTVIARRRGLHAEEAWENTCEDVRSKAVRAGLAVGASIFYAMVVSIAAKYIAQNFFALTLTENKLILFVALPVAIIVCSLLWPRTEKILKQLEGCNG